MDQLVGATGEQLSFTIYWLLWPIFSLTMTENVFKVYLPEDYQLCNAISFGLAALSFVIVYFMIQCYNHVLVTKTQVFNSFKLIFQVVHYAKKHKYP